MKQAVILAAGEGLRLWPFTVNKPKSMLFVAGKPIIQHVIKALSENGIRDLIIIEGYKKEYLLDFIGDGSRFGVSVHYIDQKQQLGTAHALAQAYGFTDEEFLVVSGSKFIMPDTITRLIQLNPPAILVRRNSDPGRYGVVSIKNGKLTGITEKPTHPKSNVINTGIYIFKKEIFDYIGQELGIPDVLNKMLERGEEILALDSQGTWQDVVFPWDILDLNSILLDKLNSEKGGMVESGVTLKGPVCVGKNSLILSNSYVEGPVFIGEGCRIGPSSCILPSTSIADNVVIGPFSEIRNSVIEDDVIISSGSTVHDSVVDKGCLIGSHFSACSEETEVVINDELHKIRMGAMIGEGCKIGNSVTSLAGTIVGNYCQINSHNLISGKIPDRSQVV
jgi:UDP-N-acetylglucosamine diphosphorylase / glucose-1-phosphate thymidylyltransferase / UDP-N-acetylgalactosamine diphosphorylase / glucosamine-1-phosphate N-acetyltransferase / galactosamine-1-phosphate N-acetyltransferase